MEVPSLEGANRFTKRAFSIAVFVPSPAARTSYPYEASIRMGKHDREKHPVGQDVSGGSSPNGSSGKLVEGLIRSAVLGLAFGSVLFIVSDQTGLLHHILRSLDLSGMAKYLGPKHLVIVGILLGVGLHGLDRLSARTRRAFGKHLA